VFLELRKERVVVGFRRKVGLFDSHGTAARIFYQLDTQIGIQ
jgi:hypothetical protein